MHVVRALYIILKAHTLLHTRRAERAMVIFINAISYWLNFGSRILLCHLSCIPRMLLNNICIHKHTALNLFLVHPRLRIMPCWRAEQSALARTYIIRKPKKYDEVIEWNAISHNIQDNSYNKHSIECISSYLNYSHDDDEH